MREIESSALQCCLMSGWILQPGAIRRLKMRFVNVTTWNSKPKSVSYSSKCLMKVFGHPTSLQNCVVKVGKQCSPVLSPLPVGTQLFTKIERKIVEARNKLSASARRNAAHILEEKIECIFHVLFPKLVLVLLLFQGGAFYSVHCRFAHCRFVTPTPTHCTPSFVRLWCNSCCNAWGHLGRWLGGYEIHKKWCIIPTLNNSISTIIDLEG